MIKVKYRSGYPTKISLQEAIDSFFVDTFYKPHLGSMKSVIKWQRNGINERIKEFIDHLTSLGIEVEKYNLYDSPTVGMIILKKKL